MLIWNSFLIFIDTLQSLAFLVLGDQDQLKFTNFLEIWFLYFFFFPRKDTLNRFVRKSNKRVEDSGDLNSPCLQLSHLFPSILFPQIHHTVSPFCTISHPPLATSNVMLPELFSCSYLLGVNSNITILEIRFLISNQCSFCCISD